MNHQTFKGIQRGSTRIPLVILFLFAMCSSFPLKASWPSDSEGAVLLQQEITISGSIVDAEGNPLPGVSIVVKGTTRGTTSDVDGNFEISVPPGSTLVISFVGFQKQEIQVDESISGMEIVMQEKLQELEEVVVIGYGSQRKETVTGSMASVAADELAEQPVSDVTQSLAGKLPGLIANQSGGRPGKDASTIKIRGIGTLDAGSGSDPLIMIDGIERDYSTLTFLDPNEIESISILKDASSTAVFGVRGANGVILVTTKRGQEGPAKMSYSSNLAFVQPTFEMDLVDTYTQTGLINEYLGYAANTTNSAAPFPQSVRNRYKGVLEGNPVHPSDPFFYPSTDYEELMFKDMALQQKHNFTINGGMEDLKYFVSLGYFDKGGLFASLNPELDKSTSFRRYNYRANVDINLTPTTLVQVNIGGNYNRNINLGQPGVEPNRKYYFNLLRHSTPWDGYVHDDKVVMLRDNANSVMLGSDMRGYNLEMQNTAAYTLVVDQDLDVVTKGLSIKGKANLSSYVQNYVMRDVDEKKIPTWKPVLNADSTVNFYQTKEDVLPSNSTSQNKNRKEYYEVSLNYERSFNNHNIGALALFNAEKSHFTESFWNSIPRSYLGIVGRVTYNYRNRYMAEFNAGYNGSENFAEGERFGFFPSYSLGWSFTEEPWFRSLVSEKILSYGKFRFSYGKVGNDKINRRFLYLPDRFNMNSYWYGGWHEIGVNFGTPGSIQDYPVAYQGAAGNPNVTWETSTKINYGAELVFLDGRLKTKFDYFTEDRKDILINQRVVPVYQQTGQLALNLGRVVNEGYEIELGWNDRVNQDFRYWINGNYSFARNEIKEMDEPEQPYKYRMQTGMSVGQIWGYQQEGYFETEAEANEYRDELWETYLENNPGASQEDYQAYQIFDAGSDVGAGDLKFIDRNGDGLITSDDEGYLDMVNFPESMFGLDLGFQYKSLSLSMLLQGATNYSVNARTAWAPNVSGGSLMGFVLDRYTPGRYEAGESIDYPRLIKTNDNWQFNGNFWTQDATYLRLKNLQLAYTFDSSIDLIQRLGMDNIQFYVSGHNLLTFTKLETIDPETTDGQLQYPRSRVFNIGVKAQF